MRYKNASDILPDKLLSQLQEYAAGEVLYVPSNESRKKWGENSGARKYYSERNEEIRRKYFSSAGMEQLADEYGLSIDTIRKILYK